MLGSGKWEVARVEGERFNPTSQNNSLKKEKRVLKIIFNLLIMRTITNINNYFGHKSISLASSVIIIYTSNMMKNLRSSLSGSLKN